MTFELTTLGEYARVQGGYAYKSKDFSESGKCPVLKIKNVRFGNVDYAEASFISEEIANETKDWKTKEGDILISMTGSGPNAPQSLVGRVARVWEDEPDAWINQRVGRIVLKEEGSIHPDFLFYLISTPRSQDYLVSNSSGSANQANISGKTIESLPCPKVDFDQSAAIAKILRELDQKILLNRQINQTLEQIAQAIFKSWFVDFEPVKAKAQVRASAAKGRTPESGQNSINEKELEAEMNRAVMRAISGKTDEELDQLSPEQRLQLTTTAALFPDELEDSELGEIPKGWKVKPLDKVADYLNGLALQKFPAEDGEESLPVIKIAQLKKGDSKGADRASKNIKPEYVIDNGDVIFSWSGSLFIDIWCGGEGALNQHLFKVTSDNYPKWFYLYWTNYHLTEFQRIAADKAVTMGHIKRGNLSSAMCLVPVEKLINSLGEYISTLVELSVKRRLENENLAKIRDSLLPKLLSGEITPSDTQSTAEAVA